MFNKNVFQQYVTAEPLSLKSTSKARERRLCISRASITGRSSGNVKTFRSASKYRSLYMKKIRTALKIYLNYYLKLILIKPCLILRQTR